MTNLNIIFTAVFVLECLVKIIAMGFVMHKTAYLRDTWNWLDFFIVLVSVADLIPGLQGSSLLKSFRSVRVLRPLRSINRVKRLKLLIHSLFNSIPGLVNVGFFLGFVLSIFAIFGVL
jgi:voltage-dependent calcium channel L type alpha-1D